MESNGHSIHGRWGIHRFLFRRDLGAACRRLAQQQVALVPLDTFPIAEIEVTCEWEELPFLTVSTGHFGEFGVASNQPGRVVKVLGVCPLLSQAPLADDRRHEPVRDLGERAIVPHDMPLDGIQDAQWRVANLTESMQERDPFAMEHRSVLDIDLTELCRERISVEDLHESHSGIMGDHADGVRHGAVTAVELVEADLFVLRQN